jgi:SAM-dependent methyltransferase
MTPINDPWDHGNLYEQYVGRWSRRVAPVFLEWLGVAPGKRWLDVGCGTGALCGAILDACKPSSVTGVEPSEGFLVVANENLAGRASLHAGSATQIPLEDASVDVVVSGLMLNFVKDPPAALVEMTRVVSGGGVIAAYLWDYAGRMDLMRNFWDAAVELDPAAAALDEGARFPLCNPDAMDALWTSAGLHDVDTHAIDIETVFASFDDCWKPFLGGQGPAPGYAMSLDDAARIRLRDKFRARLSVRIDGSIAMIARAWAVRGTVSRPSKP